MHSYKGNNHDEYDSCPEEQSELERVPYEGNKTIGREQKHKTKPELRSKDKREEIRDTKSSHFNTQCA
jgi:hypothetical protein